MKKMSSSEQKKLMDYDFREIFTISQLLILKTFEIKDNEHLEN